MNEKTKGAACYFVFKAFPVLIWNMLTKFSVAARNGLSFLTNHEEINDIKCFNDFVEYMYKPVDAASLGVGRFAYGLIMLIDLTEERGGAHLDLRWGKDRHCYFPLFSFLKPLPLPQMCILYGIMWIGALGITLGYKYRISTMLFAFPYWYIFLLDKSVWNNHSYLYGLCALIFMVLDANKTFSLDAHFDSKKKSEVVPFWNYFLIKYQFFILYFYAGLKKFCAEWLTGYAMVNLSYHWVFTPFRLILGSELTDLLIVHWFGCLFDLTIAFLLIYKKTRLLASPICIAFHFMNSRLFSIGMFPWLCLVEMPLFYDRSWPRMLKNKIFRQKASESAVDIGKSKKPTKVKGSESFFATLKKRTVISLLLVYCGIQAFLPYSHFITKGYNNWTDGIYGYSWDMMVHAWDSVLVVVKVVDNGNNEVHYLNPFAFTDSDRWTRHADMAKQYAECVNKMVVRDFLLNPNTEITSDNISVYFDVWYSLNGRFQQRVYDPTVDILKAPWSPFAQTEWVLPLLMELSDVRTNMTRLTKEVLSYSMSSDLIFVADFPGMTMNNYISPELDNVTLSVLDGTLRYVDHDANESIISSGESMKVDVGEFHQLITTSPAPASCVYTFENKTLQQLNERKDIKKIESNSDEASNYPGFFTRVSNRIENYKYFFGDVSKSIIFELSMQVTARKLQNVRKTKGSDSQTCRRKR